MKEDWKAAFEAGFKSSSCWPNPFKEDLAGVFVDGWVAGFKEYGPRSEYEGKPWPR